LLSLPFCFSNALIYQYFKIRFVKMTEIWKWGRVQFAQDDYQLLVGSFLVIFALITIGYFSLFSESSSHDDETPANEPEHHATSHHKHETPTKHEIPPITTSSSSKKHSEPERHEVHSPKKTPVKETTPKKHLRSPKHEEEAPVTRTSTGSSKSPVHHQEEGNQSIKRCV
jgi:ABC-type nickel/cobalt efflux system permease component RcnA